MGIETLDAASSTDGTPSRETTALGTSSTRIGRAGACFDARYQVVRLLKEGNGIQTLLGTDLNQDLPVIIKVTASGALSTGALMRLEHDAQVLRDLHSPWLGSLVAVGREHGMFYVVMSRTPGITLQERLGAGPLSVEETLTVGRCILAGLQEAHDHGVLHRDIKPANIIVDETEPLRGATLIDFGLSRSSRLDEEIRDVPAGTALYMAPEQAGLLHADIDERADLYAVGVLLFACLAGRPPFMGETLGDVLRQHLTARPPQLRQLGLGTPRALDDLIGRLLRKDPRERYQTAEGALADLETLARALKAGVVDPPLVLGLFDNRCALSEPSFVGRDAELAALEAALANARQGRGGLVLLEAESGTGKTRLMSELAHRSALHGGRVLRGQGVDLAAQRPFQLLDGLVGGLAAAIRTDPALVTTVRERLGEQANAVCDALPRMGPLLGRDASQGLGPAAFGEIRSLRALVTFLDALGAEGAPALVLLDDCQWADELTLKLLQQWQGHHGEQRPRDRHVLIVAGFRSEEVGPQHLLRHIPDAGHVTLGPFNGIDIRRMAESMAGQLPIAVLDLVEQIAGGSPFMAEAVLRGLVETGSLRANDNRWCFDPPALGEVQSSRQAAAFLRQRLGFLPAATRRLLAVAAVLGKEFELDLAARLAEQTPQEALQGIQEARRRHLVWVRDHDDRYAFTHDKLRETLLEFLTPEDRQELHRIAALSLEEKDQQRVFDLAYHFDAAGESARALPYALAAAEQARCQHALAIAEQQYRIAARAAPWAARETRQLVADRLGEVLMLRGQYREAETQFQTARALARTSTEQARIVRSLGELAMKSGDLETAAAALENGLRLLGRFVPRRRGVFFVMLLWEIFIQVLHTWLPRLFLSRRSRQGADEELLAVALYNRLGYVYYFERGTAPCLWTHLRGMNLAERYPPTPELALAYSSHAPAMAMAPMFRRGVAYARRSQSIRKILGDVWGQGQSLHFYGSVLYAASRLEEALERCRQAIGILERTGDQWEVNMAGVHVAYILYRQGRLREAVAETMRVQQAATAIGDLQCSAICLTIRARALDGRVAAEPLRQALERCGKDAHTRVELLGAEGVRLLRTNCPAEAASVLEEAERIVRRRGLRQEFTAAVVPWLVTALRRQLEATPITAAHLRRRLLRRAWRKAKRAWRISRSFQNNLSHSLRELGYLAAIRAEPRQAQHYLEQSLAVARRQGAKYEEALTLQARGQIGMALDWPNAADEARQAAGLLQALQPPDEQPETPAAPATLSLADRFDTVLTTGRQIASSLSPEAVYAAVHEGAQRLLRGENCVVLECRNRDAGPDIVPVLGTARVSRSLVQHALTTGRPVQMDSDSSPDLSDSFVLAGFRSVLYAPFFVRGTAAGCFCVTHGQVGGLFGRDEQRLAEFIATVAGAALENAEGFARLQEWNAELEARVAERTAAAEERARELQKALDNVQTLNGLLPICASCKMIRDDRGYWHQVELYIKEHSAADFSHGICPQCAARFFPGMPSEANAPQQN